MKIENEKGITLKELKSILNKFPENESNEYIVEFEYKNLSGLHEGSTLYLTGIESLYSAFHKAIRLKFTGNRIKRKSKQWNWHNYYDEPN